MTFGKRLKQLRMERGWTQADLAERLGVPRSSIAGYESTDRIPREELLIKMAKVLNTSVDFLLGRTDNKQPVEEIQKEIESSTPDLLDIITRTKPHIDGVPIDEETAQFLYYQLKAIKEKLLREMDKKKLNRLGAQPLNEAPGRCCIQQTPGIALIDIL